MSRVRERTAAKGRPKACKQKDLCPFWSLCRFNHDANKCRMSFDADDDNAADILEID